MIPVFKFPFLAWLTKETAANVVRMTTAISALILA